MSYPRYNRLGKIWALLAATLILPVLTYAQNNQDQNQNNQDNRRKISTAPEANAAWVLVPFFGAVLVFSARQLLRSKAAQK